MSAQLDRFETLSKMSASLNLAHSAIESALEMSCDEAYADVPFQSEVQDLQALLDALESKISTAKGLVDKMANEAKEDLAR